MIRYRRRRGHARLESGAGKALLARVLRSSGICLPPPSGAPMSAGCLWGEVRKPANFGPLQFMYLRADESSGWMSIGKRFARHTNQYSPNERYVSVSSIPSVRLEHRPLALAMPERSFTKIFYDNPEMSRSSVKKVTDFLKRLRLKYFVRERIAWPQEVSVAGPCAKRCMRIRGNTPSLDGK